MSNPPAPPVNAGEQQARGAARTETPAERTPVTPHIAQNRKALARVGGDGELAIGDWSGWGEGGGGGLTSEERRRSAPPAASGLGFGGGALPPRVVSLPSRDSPSLSSAARNTTPPPRQPSRLKTAERERERRRRRFRVLPLLFVFFSEQSPKEKRCGGGL
jgi:hypothetical protein